MRRHLNDVAVLHQRDRAPGRGPGRDVELHLTGHMEKFAWSFDGSDGESRSTQASADFMLDLYGDMAANVIGRRVFDMTNGWNGKPAAGEHVFVVTHRPPTDWEYADTAPFTFVDGVEKAITAAREFAGDRVVDVAAGQIGGQALRLGLIDQVVVNGDHAEANVTTFMAYAPQTRSTRSFDLQFRDDQWKICQAPDA